MGTKGEPIKKVKVLSQKDYKLKYDLMRKNSNSKQKSDSNSSPILKSNSPTMDKFKKVNDLDQVDEFPDDSNHLSPKPI